MKNFEIIFSKVPFTRKAWVRQASSSLFATVLFKGSFLDAMACERSGVTSLRLGERHVPRQNSMMTSSRGSFPFFIRITQQGM
jgi:hypothetical protein